MTSLEKHTSERRTVIMIHVHTLASAANIAVLGMHASQ